MELYEEIKADREAGARRLVDEYRSRLMGMAMGLTKSSHEAEDLVFRTFERVILKIDDYKPTGSFYYWMCAILMNFHRMDVRKAAVRPQFAGDGKIPEVAAPETHDISDALDFEATTEAVRQAVRELPENFREVVVLKYFDEMSTEDIAMVTGLNVGTVKSRLHYAKEALYAKLHDTELSAKFTDRLILATKRRAFMKWTVGAVAMLAVCTLVGGVALSLSTGDSGFGFGGGQFHGYGGGTVRRAAGIGGKAVTADATERAIANGLEYLARTQKDDGSYPGEYGDSAAIPALAGMAFLAKGHLPGSEPYGERINRAIDWVIGCADMRETAQFQGYMGGKGGGRMYAHSIATLFLAEASGMVDAKRQEKIDRLLPLAAKVVLDAQNQQKGAPHLGGWRYEPNSSDSDLSCSGWALMALRSARLNGAQVPPEAIEKAVLYIKRAYSESAGNFGYQGATGQSADTLTGAAILCLELCGKHLDPMSLKGAQYLEKMYPRTLATSGQRYYGLYYTAQGLFQIGGPIWRSFAAWMYDTFVPQQRADGSWSGTGNNGSDAFATAMTVLSLTVPYRMLPIYQRDETVDPETEKEVK